MSFPRIAILVSSIMLFLCPLVSPAAENEVDPWVRSLLPKEVEKSVFPSPQHWASKPGAFEIPLNIADSSPSGGVRFISTGVPLMVAQASKISQLRLAEKGSDGKLKAVAAQFKVLARWWRFDKSIRWVLVDFQADIAAGAKKTFFLTNAKLVAPAPPARLIAEVTPELITVTTGQARFTIKRKAFNMIEGAWVDADSNGSFSEQERILTGSATSGGVTQDALGNSYLAASGTRSVEVIESGPMRVRVRARGQHLNPDGKGYKPGLYGFDVFMDFYVGSSDVFVDYVLTNNPAVSQGNPTMEDASFNLEFTDDLIRYDFSAADKATYGKLKPKESVCLYQDSNGADTWASCPGFGFMSTRGYSYPSGTVTSFKGWKAFSRSTDAQRAVILPKECGKEIASGQRARGLVLAGSKGGGLAVNVRNFWRLFPKAIEVGPGRKLRLALLPRETKVLHFLEDASSCGTEFVLRFYAGVQPPKDSGAWADRWDHRLIARPDLKHLAACGALAETGPFTLPTIGLDKKPDARNCADNKRMFTQNRLYGNAYGWQIWGDRWRSNGGHGRRGARQPISQDNYLWRWWVNGVQDWFEIGEPRSRHYRDVRVYRIENQNPFGFKDWKDFRGKNRSEKWTNRKQPKSEEYKKFTSGKWKRTDWLFPNPEHTTLDLLYDRYLLFGDVRSLENMKIAAAHGGYFSGRGGNAIERGGWPWRANGWGWRTLLRYWELTGDADAEKCLVDVIKRHSEYIGKKPLICEHVGKTNWWFTNIYCRAVAVTALQTGDPTALELCKTLAAGKEKDARRVPTLFAVLYHLTGEKKYKQLLLGDGDGGKLLSAGGYYTVCDHWLLNQPPAKSVK
jgi:PcRGLX-like protein central beta sandwich domain